MHLLQDSLNEKIKKIGGLTSFNMYLMKEFDIMNNLLQEIRSSLTARFICLFMCN